MAYSPPTYSAVAFTASGAAYYSIPYSRVDFATTGVATFAGRPTAVGAFFAPYYACGFTAKLSPPVSGFVAYSNVATFAGKAQAKGWFVCQTAFFSKFSGVGRVRGGFQATPIYKATFAGVGSLQGRICATPVYAAGFVGFLKPTGVFAAAIPAYTARFVGKLNPVGAFICKAAVLASFTSRLPAKGALRTRGIFRSSFGAKFSPVALLSASTSAAPVSVRASFNTRLKMKGEFHA